MNRRTWLQTALATATTSSLPSAWAQALASSGPLLTRAIPSSGQRLPIIGLGSSATFAQVARSEDQEALKNVMAKMVELGADLDEVMSECELPQAEAELLISLRKGRS